jgi:hypothetical protein
MIKTNVGGIDRAIRIILGLSLIAAGVIWPDLGYRWALIAIGAVAIGTGFLSTCPLYTLIGVNTCPAKRPSS